MSLDNSTPRYLPHTDDPEVLLMGLSPMGEQAWIETDRDIGRYHRHKLRQRREHGDDVYRGTAASLPAQREFARLLLDHLLQRQGDHYRLEDGELRCLAGDFSAPLPGDEPLWEASLWVADDLVIMEDIAGDYCLTAASLCSPSHWRLSDKFGQPMRAIHDPIPGFHETLTPKIDRFFSHLRPSHPVVRFNWSLQADFALDQQPGQPVDVDVDTPLYYRTERQSLTRLPETGAIAFTIRVYLHPLETLCDKGRALPLLLEAIDNTSAPLQRYKGFDQVAPALERYRRLAREAALT